MKLCEGDWDLSGGGGGICPVCPYHAVYPVAQPSSHPSSCLSFQPLSAFGGHCPRGWVSQQPSSVLVGCSCILLSLALLLHTHRWVTKFTNSNCGTPASVTSWLWSSRVAQAASYVGLSLLALGRASF